MKIIQVSLFLVSFIFTSCHADEVTVNKLADEMCQAMTRYDEEKPKTVYEAGSMMLDIISKSEEYDMVTEEQLNDAMKDKCPEGYRKFILLTEKTNR